MKPPPLRGGGGLPPAALAILRAAAEAAAHRTARAKLDSIPPGPARRAAMALLRGHCGFRGFEVGAAQAAWQAKQAGLPHNAAAAAAYHRAVQLAVMVLP